jgi:hypothetical protein
LKPATRIDPEVIEYIRENPDGLRGIDMARKFGITKGMVSLIRSGKRRKPATGTDPLAAYRLSTPTPTGRGGE